MPELPEVETIRRQLEPVLAGQRILSVVSLHPKSWSGKIEEVVRSEIVGVRRKAKVLFIATSNKQQATSYLMIHLKMTGQLIYEEKIPNSKKDPKTIDPSISLRFTQDDKLDIKSLPSLSTNSLINQPTSSRIVGGHPNNSWTAQLPDKHTRVILELDQGRLFFNDQRLFGWVRLVDQQSANQLISSMPPDIIDAECDEEYFYGILQRSGRAVKLVILDSHKVGGIGNIYANDGLFLAGIDPRRSANSLSKKETDKLLASLKHVVNLGIEMGGATAADGKFVNTLGLGGKYQEHFLVYEREGDLVERDGQSGYVEKFKLGGRGTYWVPGLQK